MLTAAVPAAQREVELENTSVGLPVVAMRERLARHLHGGGEGDRRARGRRGGLRVTASRGLQARTVDAVDAGDGVEPAGDVREVAGLPAEAHAADAARRQRVLRRARRLRAVVEGRLEADQRDA